MGWAVRAVRAGAVVALVVGGAVTEVPAVAWMTADAHASVADATGNGATDAGDVIEYLVTVGNGGTVTVTDLRVELGAVAVSCVATVLRPGATTDCTGSYAATQADVDGTGPIEVAARATATGPGGGATAKAGPLRIPLSRVTALAATVRVESVTDTNGNGRKDAGDVLGYAVMVSNIGSVTLSEVDAALGDCVADSLAPGAEVTCTATHPVTAADVAAGDVVATVTATGRTPAGDEVTSDAAQVRTAITSNLASTGLTAIDDMLIAAAVLLLIGLGLVVFVARRGRD